MIRFSCLVTLFLSAYLSGIAATVATPTFSPGAGTYTSAQTVTISTTTSGATIRYTTNGTTPTSTSGTVYSAPVAISSTTTLKAIAYKSGSTNSAVKSGTYTITLPTTATPIFNPAAGSFTSAQTVTISSATSGATIRYTTDGSTPTVTSGTVYSASTPVSISATKTLKAIAYKTGLNNSSVASGTYTINLPKVATPTFSLSTGTYASIQSVSISTATSGASIVYTIDGTTPAQSGGTIINGTLYSDSVSIEATTTLKALAFLSSYADSSVATAIYTLNLDAVSSPIIAPFGGTYATTQSIGIALDPQTTGYYYGAQIAYTTDGSTPTARGSAITHGTLYTGPVAVSSSTTVKAIAFAYRYAPPVRW